MVIVVPSQPPVDQATDSPPTGRLSADIERLLEAFADRDVTLGEIVDLMQQRAYYSLLLLIAIPFCQPIQIPGFSTPFGAMIAYIGVRIALGLTPALPKRALNFKLKGKVLPKILRAADKPVKKLEDMLHPHLSILVATGILRQMHGVLLAINGLLLALPLPFPMTNLFPALSILLLTCALLENDGRFSIAGSVAFVLSCSYFAALAFGGATLITESWDWLKDRF